MIFFFFFFNVEHFKVFNLLQYCFYFVFCFVLEGALWGMWDISSPTRDQTHIPCIGRWSPYHWTTSEVWWAVVWVWLRGHLSRQLQGNMVYGRSDFGVAMFSSVSEAYTSVVVSSPAGSIVWILCVVDGSKEGTEPQPNRIECGLIWTAFHSGNSGLPPQVAMWLPCMILWW